LLVTDGQRFESLEVTGLRALYEREIVLIRSVGNRDFSRGFG
jgi:hypothetical protein